jgi:hypothetical protein
LIKSLVRKVRKDSANILSFLSPSSKVFGPPKGYYANTDEYFEKKPSSGSKTLLNKETFPSSSCTASEKVEEKLFERHLVAIRDGRINLDPWAFITNDDKLLFKESSCYGPRPEEHWIFRSLKLPKSRRLEGKTLFLSARTNYWHLLMDELSDLTLLEINGIKPTGYDRVICESYPYPAGQELQEIFGLGKIRQASLRKDLHIECEELHFLTGSFCLSPKAVGLVRSKIMNWVERGSAQDTKEAGTKLVISRADADTRMWLNENECFEKLAPLGFKLINTSKMSLIDQVTAFSKAEIILGSHGAGLTNLLFMAPESQVIEIRSKEQGGEYSSADCFQQLSNILRLRHHVFPCEGIERKDLKGRSIEDADLLPDPEALLAFVRKTFHD